MSDPSESNFRNLPTWPSDAQDVPDKKTSSGTFSTPQSGAILGTGIGVLYGLGSFLATQKFGTADLFITLGVMLVLGFLGAGIGSMVDHKEKRDDEIYHR